MDGENTLPDLRESLTNAFSEVEAKEQAEQENQEVVHEEISDTGRSRDELGRFAKKEEPVTKETTADTEALSPPVEPEIKRPSSWKKDYWDRWDRITKEDRQFAEYLLQREQEFANGVSTYKKEWESAKPLLDAIVPFNPLLQQHNVRPEDWIRNLGTAHQRLLTGTPEEKAYIFSKLAKDYNVDLGVQPNQNALYGEIEALKGQFNQYLTAQEKAQQEQVRQEIERFSEGKPHFSEVRETMARLLDAGLATDLDGAYKAALQMPQHAEIFQALQTQQRMEEEKRIAQEKVEAAKRAKANAVSVKSATPVGTVSGGNKGLREALADAVEAHLGGRV